MSIFILPTHLKMILYGAVGYAKVIISIIIANGGNVAAVFDDDPSKIEICQIPVLGKYSQGIHSDKSIVIAIGDNTLRSRIAQKIRHNFANVIHETAIMDKSVQIGEGAVVMHASILQAGTTVGRHVIINTRVSVDHDCSIADFVHLAPGVVLCGDVCVGENTLIGAGSMVVPNITIGNNCHIAAGSVITQNIPDGAIVRGNPGRIIKTLF